MGPVQDERYITLAATELQNLAEEFTDEIERRPTSEELFHILTWGLRSEYFDALLGIHSRDLVLKPILKKSEPNSDNAMSADKIESRVFDLNDNVFVVANNFVWGDLIDQIKSDMGRAPTLDDLCSILVEGLHRCTEDVLIDIDPGNILGIKVETESASNRATS